jgi:protein subunit release factor A
MNYKEFKVEAWPRVEQKGMCTGDLPAGVRVTHIPTEISVVCDEFRQQYKNKDKAFKIILEKIGDENERI